MSAKEQKPRDKKSEAQATEIIVNGRKVEVTEKKLSFEQVVKLAFPEAEFVPHMVYTVTYKRGSNQKPKGVMVKGDVVTIKKGMVFNVTATDKS
ncbi:MAG: multiubiquitin domain-containing protein [Bacteroidota bacterium]